MSAAKLREREVTKRVKDFLRSRGWRPVRMQRTVIPGSFQTGEPGIPDFLFLRYLPHGACLCFWVEFKSSTGRAREDQLTWREKEIERGAIVEHVGDARRFCAWYEAQFGWLHDAANGIGQLDMKF